MANEIKYSGATGLTVTADVYTAEFVQQGSTVSLTEVGSTGGYLGDMPTAGAGQYFVWVIESSAVVERQTLHWDGSAEITLGTIKGLIDTLVTDIADVDTAVASVDGDIAALNDLSSQDIRDAVDLTHTNGRAGLGTMLNNLQGMVRR